MEETCPHHKPIAPSQVVPEYITIPQLTLLLFECHTHYPLERQKGRLQEESCVVSCFPPTCSLLTLLLAHIVCNQHTPGKRFFLYTHDAYIGTELGGFVTGDSMQRNIGFFWWFDVENLVSRRLGGGSLWVCSDGEAGGISLSLERLFFILSFYRMVEGVGDIRMNLVETPLGILFWDDFLWIF